MSRLAPLAGADEQLHLARALGLTPLRLRDRPRPAAPARLRIAAAEPLEILRQDTLLQALLRALNVTTEEVGPPAAGLVVLTDGFELLLPPADADAEEDAAVGQPVGADQ